MSTGTAVLFNSRWSVKQIRSRQTSEEKFVFSIHRMTSGIIIMAHYRDKLIYSSTWKWLSCTYATPGNNQDHDSILLLFCIQSMVR